MIQQAGKLRHRGDLEEDVSATRDGLGEGVPAWETVARIWFAIEPLTGREYWQAAQVQSDVTHKITFRWREGITTRHRLNWGGKIYNFLETPRSPEEGKVWLEVMAREELPTRVD